MIEYWDVYDKNRNKLDKVVQRGDSLKEDEYHIVVCVWIRNEEGKFLISRRAPNKKHPLLWEAGGGSALQNETSLDAALREVKEELGITLDPNKGKLFNSNLRIYPNCSDIYDVWIFENNTSISDVILQKEEVCDAKWATIDEIKLLAESNQFDVNPFFEEVLQNK